MHRSFFTIIFLLLSGVSFAQTIQDVQMNNSVDSLVSPQFAGNQPGISILIAKNGQIVYRKAFGSANMELNAPMQPDMVFRIGSITKQFTAVAILQLVEQGKISLQDSVQQYIKDFPSKGYTITIENLLTHTSGLVDYTSMNDPDPYIERRDFTPEFLINYFKKEPLQFKPGTKYSYSNSNYLLLGYIIQLVSGEGYHQYMADNVIKRADLTHTLYTEEKTIVPNRVQGYDRYNGFFENCYYQTLSLGFACGDLLSTTEDLYKWNNAVISGKLVSKTYIDKAFTPYKLSDGTFSTYGYGWFIEPIYGSLCIHHEGQTSGFIALEKYFPQKDIYISILTNVKTSDDKTDFSDNRFRLFDKITSLALGRQLVKEVNVSDTLLNDYVGTYSATFNKSTLTIYKRNGKLYADLSNGTGKNMVLLALSQTKFLLPDTTTTSTFEFITENGKVTKLIATQDKKYEWRKIK